MLSAARRSRPALASWVALAVLLAAPVSAQPARPPAGPADPADRVPRHTRQTDWRSEVSWHRLRVGMSQLDVLRILGEPGRITRYYAFERWEYPDALGARVNFDERGRLVAWGARAR